jgi:hypothetical protein
MNHFPSLVQHYLLLSPSNWGSLPVNRGDLFCNNQVMQFNILCSPTTFGLCKMHDHGYHTLS